MGFLERRVLGGRPRAGLRRYCDAQHSIAIRSGKINPTFGRARGFAGVSLFVSVRRFDDGHSVRAGARNLAHDRFFCDCAAHKWRVRPPPATGREA